MSRFRTAIASKKRSKHHRDKGQKKGGRSADAGMMCIVREMDLMR